MPELPEVETFARQIRPQILEKKIVSFCVTEKGLRLLGATSVDEMTAKLFKSSFISLTRHGKFLIFDLNNDWHIVAHLRMSGRFTVTSKKPDAHVHNRLYIKFQDNTYLNFIDTRRFATFHLIKDKSESLSLKRLGPDALSDYWTPKTFHQVITKPKKIIYKALLDQNLISGVGNIYDNEALFRSGISPETPSNMLSERDSKKLLHEITHILSTALKFKGTTLLDDSYRDIEGAKGEFANFLQIYGKENKACVVCKSIIQRKKLGGRSVYFCANCQKMPKPIKDAG